MLRKRVEEDEQKVDAEDDDDVLLGDSARDAG